MPVRSYDKWFEHQVKPKMQGESYLIRYADDFIIVFQYEEEAERVYKMVEEGLKQANLELSIEKMRIIPFGRFKETKESKSQGNIERKHLGILETIRTLKKRLIGHYAYYGVEKTLKVYMTIITMLKNAVFTKSRRSHKRNKYKKIINKILEYEPLPLPKIYGLNGLLEETVCINSARTVL